VLKGHQKISVVRKNGEKKIAQTSQKNVKKNSDVYENLVFQYNPETKFQSLQWKGPESPKLKTVQLSKPY
jgi:hypothetical protein